VEHIVLIPRRGITNPIYVNSLIKQPPPDGGGVSANIMPLKKVQ
jgi:hypothetical protein